MSLIPHDSFHGSALNCAWALSSLTLGDIEGSTGIDASRINDFMLERAYPSDSEIEKLAKALNVIPGFFNQVWVEIPDHAINIKWSNKKQGG